MSDTVMFGFSENSGPAVDSILSNMNRLEAGLNKGIGLPTDELSRFQRQVNETVDSSIRKFQQAKQEFAKVGTTNGAPNLTKLANTNYAELRQNLSRNAGSLGLSKADSQRIVTEIVKGYLTFLRGELKAGAGSQQLLAVLKDKGGAAALGSGRLTKPANAVNLETAAFIAGGNELQRQNKVQGEMAVQVSQARRRSAKAATGMAEADEAALKARQQEEQAEARARRGREQARSQARVNGRFVAAERPAANDPAAAAYANTPAGRRDRERVEAERARVAAQRTQKAAEERHLSEQLQKDADAAALEKRNRDRGTVLPQRPLSEAGPGPHDPLEAVQFISPAARARLGVALERTAQGLGSRDEAKILAPVYRTFGVEPGRVTPGYRVPFGFNPDQRDQSHVVEEEGGKKTVDRKQLRAVNASYLNELRTLYDLVNPPAAPTESAQAATVDAAAAQRQRDAAARKEREAEESRARQAREAAQAQARESVRPQAVAANAHLDTEIPSFQRYKPGQYSVHGPVPFHIDKEPGPGGRYSVQSEREVDGSGNRVERFTKTLAQAKALVTKETQNPDSPARQSLLADTIKKLAGEAQNAAGALEGVAKAPQAATGPAAPVGGGEKPPTPPAPPTAVPEPPDDDAEKRRDLGGRLLGATQRLLAAREAEAVEAEIDARLAKNDRLLRRGLITKEEHDQERQGILGPPAPTLSAPPQETPPSRETGPTRRKRRTSAEKVVYDRVNKDEVNFTLPDGEYGRVERFRAGYGDLQYRVRLESQYEDPTGMGSYNTLAGAKRDVQRIADQRAAAFAKAAAAEASSGPTGAPTAATGPTGPASGPTGTPTKPQSTGATGTPKPKSTGPAGPTGAPSGGAASGSTGPTRTGPSAPLPPPPPPPPTPPKPPKTPPPPPPPSGPSGPSGASGPKPKTPIKQRFIPPAGGSGTGGGATGGASGAGQPLETQLFDAQDNLLKQFREISNGRYFDTLKKTYLKDANRKLGTGTEITDKADRYLAQRDDLIQNGGAKATDGSITRLQRAIDLFDTRTVNGLATGVRQIARNLFEDTRGGVATFVETGKRGARNVVDGDGLARARAAVEATDKREARLAQERNNRARLQAAIDPTTGGYQRHFENLGQGFLKNLVTGTYLRRSGKQLFDLSNDPADSLLAADRERKFRQEQANKGAKAANEARLRASIDPTTGDYHAHFEDLGGGFLRNQVTNGYLRRSGKQLLDLSSDPAATKLARDQETKFREQQEKKAREKSQREALDNAYDPSTQNLSPEFQRIGKDFVRRLGFAADEFFQIVNGKLKSTVGDTQGTLRAQDALEDFNKKQAAEKEKQDNRDRLTDSHESPGVLRSDFKDLGHNYVKQTLGDGTRLFFRRVGDELKAVPVHEIGAALRAEAQSKARESYGGQFLTGFLSGGFGGEGGAGLGGLFKSAGTTIKYTALYSTLGLLQQGFSQLIAEMLNFEDSRTNLEIAFESIGASSEDAASRTADLSRGLQDIAITAGSNVGDVMDIASVGIRAFGDEVKRTGGDVDQFGVSFARTAQRLAILTNTSVTESAGNIRAAVAGFDLGPTSGDRINDAITNAKRFGGDANDISQGLASFAEGATQGGIDPELAAALVSRVTAATDRNGQGVGTSLTRILSIAGGSAGQSSLASVNQDIANQRQEAGKPLGLPAIDLTAETGQQLIQLAGVFDDLSAAQQKLVINQIAGTNSSREFTAALKFLGESSNLTDASLDKAAGSSGKEYQRRLGDLTAQVREFVGALRALLQQGSESGILTPLVAGFKTLTEALKAIDKLLAVFNAIPSSIRSIGFAIVELGLAVKLLGSLTQGGGIKGFLDDIGVGLSNREETGKGSPVGAGLGSVLAGVAPNALPAKPPRPPSALRRPLTLGNALPTVGEAGLGGLKTIGASLASFNVAATVAIGGLLAIGAVKGKMDEFGSALDNLKDVNKQFAQAQNPEDLKNFISASANAQDSVKQSQKGFFGGLVNGRRDTGDLAVSAGQVELSKLFIKQLDDASKGMADTGEQAARLAVFGDPAALSLETINAGMQQLATNGASATVSLATLQAVITGLDAAGADYVPKVRKLEVAQRAIQGLSVLEKRPDIRGDITVLPTAASRAGAQNRTNPARALFTDKLLGQKAEQALVDNLPDSAGTENGELDPAAKKKALDAATKVYVDSYHERVAKIPGKIKNALSDKEVADLARGQLAVGLGGNVTDSLPPGTQITGEDLAALVPLIQNTLGTELNGAAGNPKLITKAYEKAISDLKADINVTQNGAEKSLALEALATMERQFVEQQIADAELLRNAAQARARNQGEYRKIGEASLQANAALALQNDDVNALIGIFNQGDEAFAKKFRKNIADQIAGEKKKQNTPTSRESVLNAAAKAEFGGNIDSSNVVGYSNERDRLDKGFKSNRDIAAEAATKLADEQFGDPGTLDAPERLARSRFIESETARILKDATGVKASKKRIADLNKQLDEVDAAIARSDPTAAALYSQKQIEDALTRRNSKAALNAPLDAARRNFDNANYKAKSLTIGMDGYFQAQADYFQSQYALSQAIADAALITAKLGIDLTNPVQVANVELDAEKKKLDILKAQAADRKNIGKGRLFATQETADAAVAAQQLVVNGSTNSRDQAVQQDFLSNLQNADKYGRISHEAYLQGLENEKRRVQEKLKGMKDSDNGYKQLQDYLNSLTDAAKAAGDQLSGQFNLGDIDAPTVYEVRSALKARTGSILGANGSTSTAGNVTNDNSTRNVVLNGVPIQQVLALIEDLFGKKARATAKRRV